MNGLHHATSSIDYLFLCQTKSTFSHESMTNPARVRCDYKIVRHIQDGPGLLGLPDISRTVKDAQCVATGPSATCTRSDAIVGHRIGGADGYAFMYIVSHRIFSKNNICKFNHQVITIICTPFIIVLTHNIEIINLKRME
jgi:hypothetical protein